MGPHICRIDIESLEGPQESGGGSNCTGSLAMDTMSQRSLQTAILPYSVLLAPSLISTFSRSGKTTLKRKGFPDDNLHCLHSHLL